MPKKPEHSAGKSDPAKPGADTASYEQLQGAPDPAARPNRRTEKLPHERDESARSTGNRNDQPVRVSERQISDAHEDIEAGRVDTDRRGVPNDVPGGGKRGGR